MASLLPTGPRPSLHPTTVSVSNISRPYGRTFSLTRKSFSVFHPCPHCIHLQFSHPALKPPQKKPPSHHRDGDTQLSPSPPPYPTPQHPHAAIDPQTVCFLLSNATASSIDFNRAAPMRGITNRQAGIIVLERHVVSGRRDYADLKSNTVRETGIAKGDLPGLTVTIPFFVAPCIPPASFGCWRGRHLTGVG